MHLILKSTQSVTVFATRRSEMANLGASFLGVTLSSKAWLCVVSLMVIIFLECLIRTTSLRQGPSWLISLSWWQYCMFGGISTGTNWSRCRGLILKSIGSTLETKSVVRCSLIFRFFLRIVLRTWVSFHIVHLHSWFSSDLRCGASLLTSKICVNWVIQEQCIFVEIVFRLLRRATRCLRELILWCVLVFNFVFVHV